MSRFGLSGPFDDALGRRQHGIAQAAIAGAGALWVVFGWAGFAHPRLALAGVVLLTLLSVLDAAFATSRRSAAVVGIVGAATGTALAVGLNGGIASPLVPLTLVAVIVGGLAPGGRPVDAPAAALLGVTAPMLTGSLAIVDWTPIAVAIVLAGVAASGIAAAMTRAREDADADGVTGLLTRAAFERQATAALLGGGGWGKTVLLVDVDDLRVVNKRSGHLAGDAALRVVAEALRGALPPRSVVGRFGGDEFVALLPDFQGAEVATALMGELDRLNGPGVSCGLAAAPEKDADLAEMVASADRALGEAKADGKGTVRIDGDDPRGRAKAELEAMLAQGGLYMDVQPIVALASGRIVAYEALARFKGAETAPAGWFARAELAGMRVELEVACLEEALKLFRRRPPGVALTVNVSAEALVDPRVGDRFAAVDDLHGLVLELTEHDIVDDMSALREALRPLLKRGVDLAVDDMGAGYANLYHVVALAPRFLKLDRSLVSSLHRDAAKGALVEALAGYAQRTGAYLVAEGVEVKGEADLLAGVDVPLAQGYLFGRPGPPWPAASDALGLPAAPPRLPAQLQELSAEVKAAEVQRLFASSPDLEAVVICDVGHRPLGLLTQHRLLTKLGHAFGHALHAERPALEVSDRRFALVAADAQRSQIIERAMSRPLESRHDPVLLVDAQGMIAGQITMRDLLLQAGRPAAAEDPRSLAHG